MTEKEALAAPDAPISDNPSGMYCKSCRESGIGIYHCAHPEYCGGMRRMNPVEMGQEHD